MTTVARVRQPLTILSMSSQRESRSQSKRLRAQAEYDEQDGDFMFTRAKRQKTAPVKEPPPPAPEPEPAPPKSTVKKARGRPANGKKRASPPPVAKQQQREDEVEAAPVTTNKRPTRRKRNSSPPVQEEPLVVSKKRSTRRTRSSIEEAVDEEENQEPKAASRRNGATAAKDDGARRSSGRVSRKKQSALAEEDDDVQATPATVDTPLEKDPNATKIALPFSDTPINNRNKEFRKKGGAGAGGRRRSSITMRGRRASSLIENGQSAIPHKEVDPSEFFKHIEAEVQSEPRRMKQLLTWCGERALSEKPPHGTTAPAVLGARAIQDHLLKDFGSKSEFSDWFSREDNESSSSTRTARPVVIQPNPINVEHDKKIASLEARIKRLKEQRKSWRAVQTPLPQVPPLYSPDADPKKASLPETSLLDAEEAKMLDSLINPSSSFAHLKSTTKSRLQTIQASVEFKVDNLADSIHKMDLRVVMAGKQADRVLALSSERLKEREEREKEATGTKEMPVMEVLRSLGRILPENGG